MKDSGIEWIGEIPEGWEVSQLKYATRWKSEKGCPDAPVLSLYRDFGVVPKDSRDDNHNVTSLDTSNYKVVDIGDLVINKMKAWQGSMAVSDYRGIVSPAYHVCSITSSKVNKRYLHHLLRNPAYLPEYARLSTGMRIGQWDLGFDDFKNIPFLIPPLDEQSKIADYLDNGCASLDAMLSKTRSSIEEYKKLKQAVITQAVTKGVRGEREMKDSGVEWIGEIPKEWRKTQLRHCATIKSGITLGKSYSKDTVLIERPYLRVANVQGGYVDLNDLATIEVTPDEDLKYRLHSGDVLMTEGGDRDKLGRGCVWHGEIEPCLHQNHVFAVQTNETILLPEFLEYLTASDVGRSYFDVTAIKTTNLACTSSSKVLAFTIPLPPIEEQIEIVSFIKKRSLELNKLIMKKELLVQELESYKKSLIYEVVTGKREV